MKVILNPEQPLIDFLKANATIVEIAGKVCLFIPFVFISEAEGLTAVNLNSVPKEIMELIIPKQDQDKE